MFTKRERRSLSAGGGSCRPPRFVLIYELKAHGGLWRMGIIALCGNAAVSLRSHLSRIAYPPLPELYGRLFAPLRHHSKVYPCVARTPAGRGSPRPGTRAHRQRIALLLHSIAANLLTSLWSAGTIYLRSLRRWGGSSSAPCLRG